MTVGEIYKLSFVWCWSMQDQQSAAKTLGFGPNAWPNAGREWPDWEVSQLAHRGLQRCIPQKTFECRSEQDLSDKEQEAAGVLDLDEYTWCGCVSSITTTTPSDDLYGIAPRAVWLQFVCACVLACMILACTVSQLAEVKDSWRIRPPETPGDESPEDLFATAEMDEEEPDCDKEAVIAQYKKVITVENAAGGLSRRQQPSCFARYPGFLVKCNACDIARGNMMIGFLLVAPTRRAR